VTSRTTPTAGLSDSVGVIDRGKMTSSSSTYKDNLIGSIATDTAVAEHAASRARSAAPLCCAPTFFSDALRRRSSIREDLRTTPPRRLKTIKRVHIYSAIITAHAASAKLSSQTGRSSSPRSRTWPVAIQPHVAQSAV